MYFNLSILQGMEIKDVFNFHSLLSMCEKIL